MLEQGSLFPEQYPVEADKAPPQKNAGKKTAAADKKPTLKRRKKAKRKVEDYYALLGISEDAALEIIKRSYIEKVKQYPPESHPAEFQKIRRAYDNLRDPALRKEYDILRKYGESIEDLLQEATNGAITSQTVKLLERAVAIDPQHINARLALAYTYIQRGNERLFALQFNEFKKIVSPEVWAKIWSNKIEMLMEVMQEDEAFAELQKFKKANPYAAGKLWDLYLEVYAAVELEHQLLDELEAQIQAINTPAAADIALYTAWINLADALDERGKCAKAQTAARKFIKHFKSPAEVAMIVNILTEEYHSCREDEDFNSAKIFVDLALSADKNNKELQQYVLQLQTIGFLMSELNRAAHDKKLFPLVLINAVRWIAEEFQVMEDMLLEITYVFDEDFIEKLQDMAEEYATGIIYLKKKFPTIYRYYQQRWDELFKEKTAGLNREARRSLRL